MTKTELIAKVKGDVPELTLDTLEKGVGVFFNEIKRAILGGERAELRGLGSFFVSTSSPRLTQDPRSGKSLGRRAISRVRYRPSATL